MNALTVVLTSQDDRMQVRREKVIDKFAEKIQELFTELSEKNRMLNELVIGEKSHFKQIELTSQTRIASLKEEIAAAKKAVIAKKSKRAEETAKNAAKINALVAEKEQLISVATVNAKQVAKAKIASAKALFAANNASAVLGFMQNQRSVPDYRLTRALQDLSLRDCQVRYNAQEASKRILSILPNWVADMEWRIQNKIGVLEFLQRTKGFLQQEVKK